MVRNRGKQPYLPEGYLGIIKLGQGAYSVVWQVKHEGTGEALALKIDTEPNPAHRLQREYAILKRINLPGVLKVKESGQHDARDYFTMELIPGKPFTDYMVDRRGQKDFVELFLDSFQKSIVILSDLHNQGIVHIDVKPSNLLVKGNGDPVLLDFGFAEDYMLSPTAEPSGTTLDYAAPELFTGGSVSPAADIYSLGAIAYEVLSGKKLWEGKSPRELIVAKLKTPPGLGKVGFDVPSGVEALVLRMLNPDPGLRLSVAEVLSEISWLTKGGGIVVSAPVMVPRLVFGGRDEKIAELSKLVFEEKRVVLLSGESGMGKTRLLRELRFKALVDGNDVLHIEGRGPHISVVDYISSTLNIKHPEIDPASQQRPDKWSRYERVFQAIEKGGFAGVFIDAPVGLNEDEAGFLGYLSRGFDGKKGLILSQISEEVHPEAAKIVLAGLDEEKTTGLVSRTLGEMENIERLSHTVFSLSKGNPRKMNELVDILYSEGWLSWERGWVYESKENTGGLAARLEGWLENIISRLEKESRMILDMLTIAEGPLPVEVIEKIVGDKAPMVVAGLVNAGLIRPFLYLEKAHFEFGNDLVMPYIIEITSKKSQKSLSVKLAEELEKFCIKLWDEAPETWELNYLVKVAELFLLKGEVGGKAPYYLFIAGRRLAETYCLGKGKELLKHSLKHQPEIEIKKKTLFELVRIANLEWNDKDANKYYSMVLPIIENDPKEKAILFLRVGMTYRRVGNLNQAELFLTRSENCLRDPPDIIKYDQLRLAGWIAFQRRLMEEAQNLFEELLAKASTSKRKRIAHQCLATTLELKGESSDALEHLKSAIKLLETGDKSDLCRTILRAAQIQTTLGNFTETERYLEKAQAIADEMIYPRMSAAVKEYKGFFLSRTENHREALAEFRQGIETLVKVNDVNANTQIFRLQLREIECLMYLGDWDSAQNNLRNLWSKLCKVTYGEHTKPYVLFAWSRIYSYKGNNFIARRILDKTQTLAEAVNDKSISIWIDLNRCSVEIASGNLTEARKLVKICKSHLKKQSESFIELSTRLYEAEILLAEGKTRKALMIAKELNQEFHQSLRGSVLSLLGKTLIASGSFIEGLTILRECLNEYKSKENVYQQGLTLYTIAEAMFENHNFSDEAVSALDEAETIFKRLEAQHHLKKISELRGKYFKDLQNQMTPSLKNLEALSKINKLISKRLGRDGFMDELLNITLNLTKAQRGLILVAESGEFHPIASKEIDPATSTEAHRISRTIMNQVVTEQCPIYTSDALLDERFKKSQSILINDIHSFICVPLRTDEGMIGTIYLDSKKTGIFKPDNLFDFETLGNLLALSIKRTAEYKKLQEMLVLSKGSMEIDEKGIVLGSSPVIKKLYNDLEKIAGTDSNVLLEGETGSGKGVFARLIHELSDRSDKEFCCINCGILPENIFETELFGAKKGAFTGATQDRVGLLEAADCSTVFFDEITNTSPAMQAKLLEVIEEKIIRRMGDTKTRKVNLRFIFATNRDLREEVREGRFRKDLYFRINTVTLKLPPLRKRKEDIPEFVYFFLKRFSAEFNKDVTCVAEDALEVIYKYSWPGNIRELRSTIERAVLLASGTNITRDILEPHLFASSTPAVSNLKEMTDNEKKKVIEQTLRDTNGKVGQAAERLGISRRHLSRLLKRYGISPQSD